jgi:peptidoglycan-associated lipoprotein
VTLSWQSLNSNTVSIDNGIGNVTVNGSRQVTLQQSANFVATARGAGGVAVSSPVRITVNSTPAPTPARAAAPPAARPVPLSEQFQAAMQSILFDYDQARIRDSEIPKLRNNANWLKRNPSVRFTIGGHADERGSQEYNIALGDERAVAIRTYLAGEGVTENRMMTVSYGEEKPLCNDASEECWQKNRVGQFIMNP